MDRGRMKIIEFGKDEAGAGRSAEAGAPGRASGPPLKVKEFDHGQPTARPAVAAPPFVGSIKIKEFDKGPAADERRSGGRGPAVPAPGAIKIVEFGKDSARKPAAAPRRAGMKIVEFD